jgi:hypothetical protein
VEIGAVVSVTSAPGPRARKRSKLQSGAPTKTPRAGLSRGLTQRLPSVAIQKKSINQRLMDRHVPPRRCAPRDDGFCRPSLGQTL